MGKKNKKAIIEETERNLERIKTLAETGLPLTNIAALYDMTEETFMMVRRRQPAIDKAWRDGHGEGDVFLIGKLWRAVRNDNMTAIIFACKIRFRIAEYERNRNGQGLPAPEKPVKINFKAMTAVEAARTYQQVMKGEYK